MRLRLLIAAVATATALVSAGSSSAAIHIASTQRLAVILVAHQAYAHPDVDSRIVQSVPATTPITHEQTVLPVLGHHRGPQGVTWLLVRLPGRPNGHTGWIRGPGTHQAHTAYALVVDLRHRQVNVYHRGVVVKHFSVVIGRPSAPTPTGSYFVEESLAIIPGYPGGPYALALSARSNVYSEFDGGPGQIAFHGVYGIGGVPGTAVSHGCVRVDSADMAWLGTHIHNGVPVRVVV
jgi:lipoprotein-anchoring transpeptidase ErfK/SrfK